MAKEKRVEILFEPSDYERLAEVARREGRSVGGVIREAVAKYVTSPSEAERAAAWRRWRSLRGKAGSVGSPEAIKSELVGSLDDYLEGKLSNREDQE